MMTTKYIKRSLPFILAVCLLSFASCSNEDKAGEDIPTAYFSMASTRAFVDEEVQFNNTSVGGNGNYTFAWDFGDEVTSIDENPTHAYAEKGVYIVTLEITDGSGETNIYRKTIEIINKIKQIGDLAIKWTSSTHLSYNAASSSTLSKDEKFVYINTNDHVMRCYDTSNGIQKWEFNMADPSYGTVATGNSSMTASVDEDGTIYVGTGSSANGKLFAISSEGNFKWVTFNDPVYGFWNKSSIAKPSLSWGTATFDDKHVYCGNNGTIGSMIAVDKSTGKRTAYLAVNNAGPAGGVLMGPVVSKQGMMFTLGSWGMFGTKQSELAKGGNVAAPWEWKVFGQQGCNASLAVDEAGNVYGMVYIGTYTNVFCVDALGAIKWQKQIDNTGKQDQGGVVIGTDGTIYASLKMSGELPGGIIALSPTDGAIKWRYELMENLSGTPAIDSDGHILFGTESGIFYVLDSNGRDILSALDVAGAIANSYGAYASEWAPTLGKFWTSPVVGRDGTIYVSINNSQNNQQGLLVALTTKFVKGLATSVWPMRGRDPQHTSTVK